MANREPRNYSRSKCNQNNYRYSSGRASSAIFAILFHREVLGKQRGYSRFFLLKSHYEIHVLHLSNLESKSNIQITVKFLKNLIQYSVYGFKGRTGTAERKALLIIIVIPVLMFLTNMLRIIGFLTCKLSKFQLSEECFVLNDEILTRLIKSHKKDS